MAKLHSGHYSEFHNSASASAQDDISSATRSAEAYPLEEERNLLSGPQGVGQHGLHSGRTRVFTPESRFSESIHAAPTNLSKETGTISRFWESVQNAEWWWWWEICAATLSIACVGAIVGILVYIDGMTIDNWKFTISPNSLIAVMTTISKTAMMVPIASCISQLKWGYFSQGPRLIRDLELFDTASRGPWGSLSFLTLMRARALTASALAVVTLLALGFEPTAQQILQVSSRRWDSGDRTIASIPIAQSYTSKAATFDGLAADKTFGKPATSDLLYQQATIASGVGGIVPLPEVVCPAPAIECRWEPFRTLGVCTTVRNVTSDITPVCTPGNDIDQHMSCSFDFAPIRNSSSVGPTVLVPHPFNLTKVAPDPIVFEWLFDNSSIPGDFNYFVSVGSTGLDHGGGNLDLVRYKIDPTWKSPWEGEPKTADLRPTEAWNIQWYWCSHLYTDLVATPDGVRGANLTTEGLHLDSTQDGVYWINGTDIKYVIDSVDSGDDFTLKTSELALFKYIGHAFTDQLYQNTYKEQAYDNNRVLSLGRFIYGADIPQFAQNVADTLSVLVRQNNTGDNLEASRHYGTASYTVAYYHVLWPWLVLPFAEAVLTAVLLAAAIVQARRQPLLKSSQLALVYYGSEARGLEQMSMAGSKRTASRLENETASTRVRLSRNETGNIGFVSC